MKKIFLLSALALLVTASAMAQVGLHLGVKGGANMTKIDGQKFKDGYKLNYHLGGYLELGLSQGFGIQPEVIFSQSSSETADDFSDIYTEFPATADGQKVKLNYLSIPILANIKLSKNFWVQLGPQYSILMNNDETLVENGKDAFKNGDFSAVGGLWLQLPIGLSLSARYVIGLSDINDVNNQSSWKSQAIQLGIGYRLF